MNFIKIIRQLILLILILLFICGCKINRISDIENKLNNEYLSLVKWTNDENNFSRDVNNTNFDGRIIDDLFFDHEGNLWIRWYHDGIKCIEIEKNNGDHYEYQFKSTTSGGDDYAEWFDLFINDKRKELDEVEYNRIVENYNNTKRDYDRQLKLQINNAKCVSELDDNEIIYNFDEVIFGKCRYSNYTFEPMAWIVLDKGNNSALLLSKYIIDIKEYDDNTNHSWLNSSLCYWLNNDFYNMSFNEIEKQHIISDSMVKVNNLCLEDVKEYFKISNNLKDKKLATGATEYVYQKIMGFIGYSKDIVSYNVFDDEHSYSPEGFKYWLLDNSDENTINAINIECDGTISLLGTKKDNKIGVRPAMWVKYK